MQLMQVAKSGGQYFNSCKLQVNIDLLTIIDTDLFVGKYKCKFDTDLVIMNTYLLLNMNTDLLVYRYIFFENTNG